MSRLANPRGGSAALLGICAALVLSSCSGSDSSGASDKTGDEVEAAVAASTENYEKYVEEQAAIDIPALPDKPESGKSITIMTCPLQVCAQETDPAEEAAELLGWDVTTVSSPLTAEGYQSSIDQIVSNPTDFVSIIPILPNSFVTGKLEALANSGAIVIQMTPGGTDPSPDGPIHAVVNGVPELSKSGSLMGDAVVADAGGSPNTLFVWDPQSEGQLGSVKEGFTEVVEAAGGNIDILETATADIGKAIPGQVVSYLQGHPDVEYVVFILSDFAAGVPQALQSAGLDDQVKVVSRAPSPATLADIESGAQWASVAEENASNGWRTIDLFARMDAGIDPGELANPEGWHQIFVQDNITQTSEAPATPGVPDVFLKAWQLQ